MDFASNLQADLEAGRSPSMVMIKVTNKNHFPISDRFDGVPYTFKTHQPLVIPPDAARHFFAYPGDREARLDHMAKRYAWNRATEDMAYLHPMSGSADTRTLAEKYVDNVVIEPQHFDLVARAPDTEDESESETPYDIPVPLGPLEDEASTHAGKRKPGQPKRLNV